MSTPRTFSDLVPYLNPAKTPVASRRRPERILLGAKPGDRLGNKPPVRIFLASGREQFRAERLFIWSVEKQRSPGRIYEIHLLKGLRDFSCDSRLSDSGKCQFAVSHHCKTQARAIYNEVGQVWLTDPAELFDREMDDAGFLSRDEDGTSAMLIDCNRMAGVWNPKEWAQRTRKRIETPWRAAGLRGEPESRYNADKLDYRRDRTACRRYATPEPRTGQLFTASIVEGGNAADTLCSDLEREADAARFLPFSAMRPSSGWPETRLGLSARADGPEMIRLLGPRPDCSLKRPSRRISGLLEQVPDSDLPWVLDRLFTMSDEVEIVLQEPVLIRRHRQRRSLDFWRQQLQLAERLNPATSWRLERSVGLSRNTLRGGPQ